jgi:hypothetical protein
LKQQQNKTTKQNMKTVKHDGPGRPKYQPKLPRGKFTMNELCQENGVSLKTGKGSNCSKLTLVKFVARELSNRRSGLVVKVKDETSEPNSRKGLGRKPFLFMRRPNALKAAAKSNVSVSLNTTDAYEAQKEALGIAGTPTAPVTPAAPAPTPEPAPVAEVTAPVAETAPVAAPVTDAAPVTA